LCNKEAIDYQGNVVSNQHGCYIVTGILCKNTDDPGRIKSMLTVELNFQAIGGNISYFHSGKESRENQTNYNN
jgi:hypothetical protein